MPCNIVKKCICSLAIFCLAVAHALPIQNDDIALAEVFVDKTQISDAVEIAVTKAGVYLPLMQILALLDIPLNYTRKEILK